MISVIFTAGLYLLLIYLVFASIIQPVMNKNSASAKKSFLGISVLIGTGLIVRLICSAVYSGHETDMNCFTAWSDMIYNKGFANFYSPDTFTDYPPGYMYVLYIIGFLKNTFHISGAGLRLLIKLPAVLCDCALAYIVYKKASEYFAETIALIISAFILFSPAAFTDSALWGQVDSVFTLFVVLMVLCVMDKKMIAAYFLFAAGIFIKPQTLMFTPIIIYGIIENIFMAKKSTQVILKNLLCGLCAIFAMLVLSLPFGLNNVVGQYIATMKSYPYMTINAFNIWSAFGQNWKELSSFSSAASFTFMLGIVASTVPVFLKSKAKEKYLLISVLLSFGAFMLMTKMHERYAFPCIFFLVLLFIYKPNMHTFNLFAMSSAMQFINLGFVLFVYQTDTGKYYKSPFIIVFSIINIALYAYTLWYASRFIEPKTAPSAEKPKAVQKASAFSVCRTKALAPITKVDIAIMLAITAVYSCIALYSLGDRAAPVTGTKAASLSFDMGSEQQIGSMKFFTGGKHLEESMPLEIALSDNEHRILKETKITSGSVFAWHKQELPDAAVRYIDISCSDKSYIINEIAFFDQDGNLITPKNAANYTELFDEQSLVPEHISYKNGTYFDEIYHARTAYEFVNHQSVYEWTHPPLGKVLISIGIRIFGMNPFGWRIVGTVFGIFMVPVIYVFAKRAFKHTWLAAVTCILFTFDFMHFAQTRIATIDVYVTFFIMLMYYYMFKYYCMSFYDTKLSKTFVPLGICGVVMGLAIASKWTGIYAGAGLAIIFFITLYRRWNEYRHALENPKGSTDGISHKHIINTFKSSTVKTILFCCVFYIAVPALIYVLSYIPYLQAPDMHGLKSILQNQSDMYNYHSKLVAEHGFASLWYQWPIMYKPIWYYSAEISETLREGISSFGNPAVWWVGIAAFGYQIYMFIRNRDKISLFLIISYLTQLIPWIPVTRLTFIYHYFPSVPFVVLMIGYSLYNLYETNPPTSKIINIRNICFIYAAAVIALFAMFYPILSGMPINPQFVDQNLEWFSSWHFI